MNTKLLLVAASTLALAACGGTEVETAKTQENGAEVLLSEEQPPLEGDSPFVDEQDVADSRLAEADPLATDAEPLAEAAPLTLAGTYGVDIDGADETKTLIVEDGGERGTFDGEPVEIAMTDDEFSFDAPVTMDGEEQLMTFSGMFRDGMIEDGQVEAQGDGASTTFTAVREGESAYGLEDVRTGVTDRLDDARSTMDEFGDDAEGAMRDVGREFEETGREIEEAGRDAADEVEGAYDETVDELDEATETDDPNFDR